MRRVYPPWSLHEGPSSVESLSMSGLWQQFVALIADGDIRVSEHGYDALTDDGLTMDELLGGVGNAVVVEEYPDYPKGPAVLVLQRAADGGAIHAVRGVPRGYLDLWCS